MDQIRRFLRPVWLRRLSYRIQHRKRGVLPPYLSDTHLAAAMEADFPYMRALFKPEKVADEAAFNRIATLEFLCERYHAAAG